MNYGILPIVFSMGIFLLAQPLDGSGGDIDLNLIDGFITDTMGYRTSSDGVLRIKDSEGNHLSDFSFVITGEIGGKGYVYTSEDFVWNQTVTRDLINVTDIISVLDVVEKEQEVFQINSTEDNSYYRYNVTMYNNNPDFNWTVKIVFDKKRPLKISHTITNDLGFDIANTKFWYIMTLNEEDTIFYDGNKFNVDLETSSHQTDSLNDKPAEIRIGGHTFNYHDLISSGFDISDVYFGDGGSVGHPNKLVMAVGVTSGNGVFKDGATITLDPEESGFLSPAQTGVPQDDWTNGHRVKVKDNSWATETSIQHNLSISNFSFLESEGGPVPDGSTIHGVELRIYARGGGVGAAYVIILAEISYDGGGTYPLSGNFGTIDDADYYNVDEFADKGLWGRKWTTEDLKNENFILRLYPSFIHADSFGASVDHVEFTIGYEPPPVLNVTVQDTTNRTIHLAIQNITSPVVEALMVFYAPYDLEYGAGSTNKTSEYTLWDEEGTLNAKAGEPRMTSVSGKYGNAYRFEDSDEHFIAHEDTDALHMLDNQITVSAWVNKTNTGAATVVDHGTGTNTFDYRLDVTRTTGLVRMRIENTTGSGGLQICTGTTNINDKTWHHVAGTYDGVDTVVVYVDGVAEATCSGPTYVSGPMSKQDTLLRIGCARASAAPSYAPCWEGEIDDVMILDTTLNVTHINNIMDGLSSRHFTRGEYIFRDQDTASRDVTNATINLSIASIQPYNSMINVSVGNNTGSGYVYGEEFDLSSGTISDLKIYNSSNFSLKFIFHAGNHTDTPWITPSMNSSLTIDKMFPSCTYVEEDWEENGANNCVIKENTVMGGDLILKGSGTFSLASGINITNWSNLDITDTTCILHDGAGLFGG